MEVVATAKGVRTTARKARLVAQMVSGLPVAEAKHVLKFVSREVATDISKVIRSAEANAEHNYNLDVSTLRVSRIEIEGGTVIKRFRAKPRGMVGNILKRTSHIRVYVSDEEPAPEKRRRSVVMMPRTLVPTQVAAPVAEPKKRTRKSAAKSAAPEKVSDSAAAPAKRIGDKAPKATAKKTVKAKAQQDDQAKSLATEATDMAEAPAESEEEKS